MPLTGGWHCKLRPNTLKARLPAVYLMPGDAGHELCHTLLNGLKVPVYLMPGDTDHELCHTLLNGLKAPASPSFRWSLLPVLQPPLKHARRKVP